MKEGWEVKTLGDLCTFSTGGTPRSSVKEYYQDGDINWVVSGDVHKKQIWQCEKKITKLGMQNSNARMLPKDSVLIALNGQGRTRGTVALLRVEAACNQSIVCMYPKERGEAQAEYLYYYLEGLYHRIRGITGDKDRRGLNMPILRKIEIPVAPLPEQQRIVCILDNACDRIATARATAETNLQNARTLFDNYLQSIFIQRGEGWVERQLAELCDIKHGFAFSSMFFTTEGNYIMLTPGNFYESGGYRDRGEKQKYYRGEIPKGYILEKNDLLVAMTEQAPGLLGSPILIPESGKFLHNQRLGLVTSKPGIPWTNEFFFHVFNTKLVRKTIHDSASGVKVRHTSPAKIGKVVVSVPSSVSEQRSIVSTLDELARETKRLESIYKRKLAALDELKKSLLHQAFTGQL